MSKFKSVIQEENPPHLIAEKCPYRIFVAVMIFWATALNYAYRVYFQVSLVAMIQKNETVHNETSNTTEVVELPNVSNPHKDISKKLTAIESYHSKFFDAST